MTISGNVVSFEIGKKGDSTTSTVILEVVFSDPDDIRPVEWIPGAGVDSVPAKGSRVIVHELSSGYLVAIGGNDGATPTSAAGETEIYSTADGQVKKARVKTKADGLVAIGNDVHELKDLITEMITEIKAIQTFGSPASHVLTLATKAKFVTLQSKFDLLLGNF